MKCDGFKDETSPCKEKLRGKDKRSSPARQETTAGGGKKKKNTHTKKGKHLMKGESVFGSR